LRLETRFEAATKVKNRMSPIAVAVLMLLAATSPAADADAGSSTAGTARPVGRCEQPVPPDSALLAEGAVVGRVDIDVQDIFNTKDPGQNNFAFRTVNKLHIDTHDHVIRDQLLFRPGDPYLPERLDESERLLRSAAYIYDARICPEDVHDGVVDLVVHTRDVWTLDGGFRFGRAGGANRTGLQLQDRNFLGLGKDIKLLWTSDVDRTSKLVRYEDLNVLGSRLQLQAIYSNNSDGQIQELNIRRPFFSLDSRWAFGVSGYSGEQVDKLYDLGHVIDSFRQREQRFEIFGGLSRGLRQNSTHRWTAGFTFQRDRFDAPPGGISPQTQLQDRTLAYPWVQFRLVQNGYIEEENFNLIGRTEDLNLGGRSHIRLGWSSPTFGGDRNRLIYSVGTGWGWRPQPNRIFRASLQANGRWAGGQAENLLVSAATQAYQRNFGGQLLFARLRFDVAKNLDPEHQLLLGGDTGLRGYPLRYQLGDRRVLFTLEQRFFSRKDYFHLFHLGAAMFFDAGAAWFSQRHEVEDRLLRDVGVGLRIGSSRSSRGALIHIDLAVPLDNPGSIKNVQWLVSTEQTF